MSKKQTTQVFTSDPEPSLDIKEKVIEKEKKRNNEDVISKSLVPGLAFEKFAGKVFDSSTVDFSDSVVKHKIRQISSSRPEFSVLGASERPFESPLQKYNRLKDEIQSFIKDLETLAKQQDTSKSSDVIRDISRLLSRDLNTLDQELGNIMNDKRIRPLLQSQVPLPVSGSGSAVLADKEAISKLINQIQSYNLQQAKEGKTISVPTSSVSTTSTTMTTTTTETKIDQPVYEIYYRGGTGQNEIDTNTLSLIDRRLAQLERTVGSQEESSPAFPDVQAGLRYLTRRIELLDQSKLEKICTRMKAMTAEFELLEAARSKAQQSQQHDEKIESLYSLVTRWDSTAQQVPLIVARLQSLRDIHEESATALLRLDAAEKQFETIQTLLTEDKTALAKLSSNFGDNMKVMEANLSSLENRFATLGDKIEKLQKLKAIKL